MEQRHQNNNGQMWKLIWNVDLYEPCENMFKHADMVIDLVQNTDMGFELVENYASLFCYEDKDGDKQSISDFVDLELIEQSLEQMDVGDIYYWCDHPLSWDFKIIKI